MEEPIKKRWSWITSAHARLWGQWSLGIDAFVKLREFAKDHAEIVLWEGEAYGPGKVSLMVMPHNVHGNQPLETYAIPNRDRFYDSIPTWIEGYQAGVCNVVKTTAQVLDLTKTGRSTRTCERPRCSKCFGQSAMHDNGCYLA